MAKRKPKLTRQKAEWVEGRDTYLVGEPLRLNPLYADRKAEEAEREVRKMHLDISKQVRELFKTEMAKETIQEIAMDASITSAARVLTNQLKAKWGKRFNEFSKSFVGEIFDDITKITADDMDKSMQKMTGQTQIRASTLSPATKDIIKAGTVQATSLIKSISGEYIGQVQEALMRSITSTQGSYTATMEAIDSMLQGRYKKYKNKAKNITLDQTKKAYSSISESRMKSVGLVEYRWRHAGGSQEPREYHKHTLNGQVFRLDDPPIIDPKTGQRGHPGDAINCNCYKVPVFRFQEKR